VRGNDPQFEVGDRVFYIGTRGVIVAVQRGIAAWTYDVELATGETVRGVYAPALALHV
jgi:hypothetical protein